MLWIQIILLDICPHIQSILYTNYQHNQDATDEVMAYIKDRQGEICNFFSFKFNGESTIL